ncbi:head protein [Mycobacterium phage EvilGenius]|uniref:Uncharacterized protein n=1 Tax=Mycobacterium phage EvilGenius TaxID=1821723 RepID=A0A143FR27_9CAUD|nr:head protein [Mycobacterium phage EvilGenius]AMW64112.1 hypothetical protein SEA_EVILGENIUS_35 [Mycobacterium phage EvilGenius]AMW64291.1 hypothetical protein SEA_CHIPMUNK_35 [Mycobacterium phage ChipMunk]
MATGVSQYLANKLLDHAFRGVVYTPPTTIYAQFHTDAGDPGAAGTANISAGSTRKATTWNAAASGSIGMGGTPPETQLTATENLKFVSFWDAPTGGNFLYSAQASVIKGGVSGDIIRIATNSIGFTPLAA